MQYVVSSFLLNTRFNFLKLLCISSFFKTYDFNLSIVLYDFTIEYRLDVNSNFRFLILSQYSTMFFYFCIWNLTPYFKPYLPLLVRLSTGFHVEVKTCNVKTGISAMLFSYTKSGIFNVSGIGEVQQFTLSEMGVFTILLLRLFYSQLISCHMRTQ